ncbi:MAG: hypothetical protein IJ604_02420 [Prevotella sp.]|nr:hypothetical protein [Prevotella sp.]
MKDICVLSFLFTIVLLVVCVSVLSNGFCFNISETILTLIGICTTIIIGVAVVDSVSFFKMMEKTDIKIKMMEDQLNELKNLKVKVEKTKRQTNTLFHYTWGTTQIKDDPYAAVYEFMKGIISSSKDDDIDRAKSCLTKAEEVLKDIEEQQKKGILFDCNDRITDLISDEFKKTKVYCAFNDRIENLISKIRVHD